MSCQVYKEIQMQSVKRRSVRYDCVPDIILDQFQGPEEDSDLLSAIQELPRHAGAVLVLRVYQGLSNQDAADILGISSSTVSRRYAEAIKILRASV